MDVRSDSAALAVRQVEPPPIPMQEVVSGRNVIDRKPPLETTAATTEPAPRPAEPGKGQVIDVVG